MPILVNDKEEVNYIQKELNEIGFKLDEDILAIIVKLHYKFLAEKGQAPKDPEFDKVLEELKKGNGQ